MKNFGLMVKMMVMAIAMGALFCSCNVAGGSDYYGSAAVRESTISATDVEGPGQSVTFSLKFATVDVSIIGEEIVKVDETAIFTAEATEGAVLSWYLNGRETAETGAVYEFSCSYPGLYDLTCIAISADGKMCSSASKYITVLP